MNQLFIGIKKLQAIVLDDIRVEDDVDTNRNKMLLTSLNAQMVKLGFVMSRALFAALVERQVDEIVELYLPLVEVLKSLKGDDVNYQPMYPGFPKQVQDMSESELYYNALMHYWSGGLWKPLYENTTGSLFGREQDEESGNRFGWKRVTKGKTYSNQTREQGPDESCKPMEIGLADRAEFEGIFTRLLSSNDSLSEQDKTIVRWFLDNQSDYRLVYPDNIDFAENRCLVTAALLEREMDFSHQVKSATDILRTVTYLSGGDVSLAENTKFASLPRPMRRMLVKSLEKVIREEDIGRHKNKWVKLFHNLHVGDYSKKVYAIAQKARSNQALAGFNSEVERLLVEKDVLGASKLLAQRPGEFGRRLDHLLRLAASGKEQKQVLMDFILVLENIPTRNLLQLLGHMKTRFDGKELKIIFPKGSTQTATVVECNTKALNCTLLQILIEAIESALMDRFSREDKLGKVWIEPQLQYCPLPTQQRSASSGLFNVARGTRLPIGDKNTLRFFIYWKGRDIDLSATLHNRNFGMIEQISYTKLKSRKYEAHHSGDITSAPRGASEFIDITIDKALEYGARYVAMNVMVYSGPTFQEHEVCYAGWMTRERPNSNEVYDAKTVEQKIDVRSNSRNVIPVVFDLKRREAIWVDLTAKGSRRLGGNNVHSNKASIEEKIEAIVKSDNKVSLFELFNLHARARGEVVFDREDADTVFALDEGIGPYQIDQINSEYVV